MQGVGKSARQLVEESNLRGLLYCSRCCCFSPRRLSAEELEKKRLQMIEFAKQREEERENNVRSEEHTSELQSR